MGKIYKNQDRLRIKIHTNYDLSSATSVLIKYKNPNGDTGNWAATIEDITNGIVYKDFLLGETLGVSGVWIFWIFVTFSDSRVIPGESFTEMVYDEES